MDETPSFALLNEIVDRVSVGILVVNKNYELVLWNNYMENYSQKKAEDIIGKNIFTSFPDLPKSWLEQKVRNVFILKNFSFTSWEHRPYLFKFFHNRPITGGIDYMRQNCTFLPIKGESGDIEYVCITLLDVTDTSIYEGMLKSAVKSLAESSNRDGLTNIYNRRFLEQSMSKEFARIKRYGGTLSFIIIDLDHFKRINDNYGHLAGDEILKIASKRIGECLRESDILARYGGEEFAVMLPETPLQGADILANRLCKYLAKDPVFYNDIEIRISASLGVAEFQPDLENHEQLISRADSVLYVSKENGRNQVTIFDHNDPDKFHKKEHDEHQSDDHSPETVEPSTGEASESQEDSTLQTIQPASAPQNDTETDSTQISAEERTSSQDAIDESIADEAQPSVVNDSQTETNVSDEKPIEDKVSAELSADENQTSSDTNLILASDAEELLEPENSDSTPEKTESQEEIRKEEFALEPELEGPTTTAESIPDEIDTVSEVTAPPAESEQIAETLAESAELTHQDLNETQELTAADDEEVANESISLNATDETNATEDADAAEPPKENIEFTAEEFAETTQTEDLSGIYAENNEQLDPIETDEIVENAEIESDTMLSEDHKELTAEEKADLAMIAAFGKELEEENPAATIINMNTAAESKYPAETETKNTNGRQQTIYVKLGSK